MRGQCLSPLNLILQKAEAQRDTVSWIESLTRPGHGLGRWMNECEQSTACALPRTEPQPCGPLPRVYRTWQEEVTCFGLQKGPGNKLRMGLTSLTPARWGWQGW